MPAPRRTWRLASPVLAALLAASVQAQTAAQTPAPAVAPAPAPATAPAPAPAAAPSWQQGRSATDDKSSLHPIAPILTGRPASELPLDKLKVPAGFKVEVWAEGIPEARSLALGDKGTVFVSNRNLTNVYAVTDRGGTREVKKILSGLKSPNGIAFSKGTLYVAERHRITRYDGIEDRLDSPPEAKVVIDNLDPTNQAGHFWKFLAMGPDGKLYFNIGAPGNIVMPSYMQATINRVDPATGKMERVAEGVRNSVGFDWHPRTKQLWFTNHARDWVGDDLPHDTLHRVTRAGMNFGYPFCHQGDLPDPEFGKARSCAEFDKPALNLGAHVAPLGMRFYTGSMFPAEYRDSMLVALHGSWNRTTKQGYSVVRVVSDAKGGMKLQPFLEGFLQDAKADPPMWGRPVDVLQLRDGSVLVSDDYNGVIYRVSYAK
ncbi:PQQ-dependent sugar dehydrogenase [Ramlibacter algicola]|uniref:PQQ-dependent sugar dehydrogenase n=1 Tax=Ramlibacter algicola TaxID=2795217 RepID=A0A934Q198_9BURK|nr:PQQ-dependent sugar dehydrogenase [Ramlibacter algicola]MBK0392913.1 PQQ-dependent sugar dehydrogenase [Ramlibacter algicola]